MYKFKVLIIDTILFLKLLKDHCYVMYCLHFPNMRERLYDTLALIEPAISYLFKAVLPFLRKFPDSQEILS
jgi:hypothetical protein